VTWAQYGDFVEDGGYDERSHWSAAGWAWLEREARRTPRHVEQLRHGVLQRRFGRVQRVPAGAPVVHVARHEAEAWCRWAGRRLPTEVEWEIAASRAVSRGFRLGSVREWTAGTLRPFAGWRPGPRRALAERAFGLEPVLRGWSSATPATCADVRRREHAPAEHDAGFVGFRSCSR
jgi:formylglycine-generating enzyme required for sulfatase activity